MRMVRLLRTAFLVFLLCLQATSLLAAGEAHCGEAGEAGDHDGICDAGCVQCTCCASRAPIVADPLTVEPADAPTLPIAAGAASSALPPPPSDILHVPKSA